jgi:pimeloyl-ACP methyl ester carboxylesterase
MDYVTSLDGTRVAFEQLGQGQPVVVVGGLFNDRSTIRPLAEELARHLRVINYDRRGRGESSNTLPYAPEREVEDLAALLAQAGGSAAVYGHSSGAGLALNAAAAGLPITRLIAHEPPYGADDEESRREARALAEGIRTAIAEDRRADAIELFLAASGMPPEMIEAITSDPRMLAVAPTMPYDFELMGDFSGGTIPEAKIRSIGIPTLVIAGSASPQFFRDTADRLVQLLPNGRLATLEGHDHGAPSDVVAPLVVDFLAGVAVEAG